MSRQEKVCQALKKEISSIIHDELKDPRIGFITITAVELTADLRYAKVFFSVLGKEEELKNTKEALDSAIGYIRRLVAQRVKLRFVPELIFKEDHSSEYSIKIQEVLEEINKLSKNAIRDNKKTKERKSVRKKSSRVHKKK
jgi:ribosome-binding factor A